MAEVVSAELDLVVDAASGAVRVRGSFDAFVMIRSSVVTSDLSFFAIAIVWSMRDQVDARAYSSLSRSSATTARRRPLRRRSRLRPRRGSRVGLERVAL